MIIIGYQGIGKSTLANKNNNYIDLESSNFWYSGGRPENWHIYYCNIAEHLSKQGYNVFVSSHEAVRKRLKNSSEIVICVYPSIFLADQWIEKLRQRYNTTLLFKDYKAWKNAENRYHENISELMMCGIPHIEINSLNYDLKKIIESADYSYLNNLTRK